MKHIDTGIFSFEKLIKGDCYYVDKTQYLYNLIINGSYYFCARPRRFGKSLTISTFEAIFKGKRELFKGLYIDSKDYDWKCYPVIHLDFAGCSVTDVTKLENYISDSFKEISKTYQVEHNAQEDISLQFSHLINNLAEKEDVVILIDEYDRVLSNNLFNENVEELRQVLRSVYEVIKGKSDKIKFCFMTGVTKYAKLSIFSALNNLNDITYDKDYANMFGYTQQELEDNFGEYIDKGCAVTELTMEEYLQKMKEMYDGYCFCPGTDKVYNPVSVGFFFSKGGQNFKNYWMETGNMTMLMELAKRVDFSPVLSVKKPLKCTSLSAFDLLDIVKNPDISLLQAMLLQTGYLTIKKEGLYETYILDFPNKEIKQSFSENLVISYLGRTAGNSYIPEEMRHYFETGNVQSAIEQIKSVYSSIPYELADGFKEHGWHISFFTMLMGMGIEVNAEDSVSTGRIDCDFEIGEHIYIIEIKKDQSADIALKQIYDRNYADKFLSKKNEKTIHLVGVNFSSDIRNIDFWKEEIL